jgi:hypothetical protein
MCAAVLFALTCAGEMMLVTGGSASQPLEEGCFIPLLCVPWIAQLGWRSFCVADNEFDRRWLRFRNRFGLLWAQRVREQFNRSAAHAGWPVQLLWRGLRRTVDVPLDGVQNEIMTTLQSLLKRFEDS